MTLPTEIDFDETLRFLALSEDWHLVSMNAEGKPLASHILSGQMSPAKTNPLKGWLRSHNIMQHRGICAHVNLVDPDFGSDKAGKDDILAARFVHVDIDATTPASDTEKFKTELAQIETRLRKCDPPPSHMVFSGGGYHGYWLLEEISKEKDAVEEVNGWVADALEGDHCCINVDRVLRLPGTINWPTAKKKAAGRTPMLVKNV